MARVVKLTITVIMVVFFGFITEEKLLCQDPMFSQFYANPLYLAPSFAGTSKKGTRVALNYRDQWPAIPKAFTTYSFSVDHYFPKIKSGAGIFFMNDKQGSTNLRIMNLGALYSYDIQISRKWHVRPGIHFMYFSSAIDYSKFMFYSQLEDDSQASIVVEPMETINDIDATISTIAYNDKIWVGFNVGHLLRPNIYFYGDNISKEYSYFRVLKYSFFGGAKLRLRGNLLKYYKESLTLAYLYENQGDYEQLSLGAYYHKNPLVFGVWYRGIPFFKGNSGHDALVFLLGYELSEFIKLGYSYDLTVSGLKPSSGGAHEISFIWNFHIKRRIKKPNALPCPDI